MPHKSTTVFKNSTDTHPNTIHGMARLPVYNTWKHIMQRCFNPNNSQYANYGGRGIVVCDRWRHSFVAFHDHVSSLPHFGEKGYSLDRIDNNGNYEPDNVRWATTAQQLRNTRVNVLLTYNGKTQCVTAWAEELHIHKSTLHDRLRRGWTPERTLSSAVKVINQTRNRR